MYGHHKHPLDIKKDGLTLSLARSGVGLNYRRELGGEVVEKSILGDGASILLNPVEPVNLPKELTTRLLIEFEKLVMVSPKLKKTIYVKFPVEIGAYVHGKNAYELLDIFGLVKQKFTLYGDIKSGIICEYWQSPVFPSLPKVDPLREGVMELTITNLTNKWMELSKAVFDAYSMKLYYDKELVAMRARMSIVSDGLAETSFADSPLRKGMKKSLEIYTARKMPVTGTKFVMEGGL